MPKDEIQKSDMFINDKTMIVQSNYLIEHKEKLSLQATQLLYTITGLINKDDEDFKDYYIDVKKYAELWGISNNNIYYNLQCSALELQTKGVFFETKAKNGKMKTKITRFICYYEYQDGEQFAIVRFDKALKDCYIGLSEKFSKFTMKNIFALKTAGATVNTIRTFELLKEYQKIQNRNISVTDYKKALGLIEFEKDENGKPTGKCKEKYKNNITNLQKKVIIPSLQIINEVTDINATYTIKGRGKKQTICFVIKHNNREQTKEIDDLIPPIDTEEYDEYIEEHFTTREELLLAVIPIDVHSYDKDKLKAIYNLASSFISGYDEEKELQVINIISRFTMAIWKPVKSKQVKSKNVYGYYYACFERWLKTQFDN